MQIKNLKTANLKGKKVILRVDYNVPLKDGKIMDVNRIKESLPTIKYLLKNNCTVIILSHLGRPEGKKNKNFSLYPVAHKLQKLLHKKITFIDDCIGTKVENKIQQMKNKHIIMLENLRFYEEEEKNDNRFAKKLSKLGEIYINDAFGCAHRAHASISGITKYIPSYAGMLLLKEYENLSSLLHKLKYPVTMIVGGAKIDGKIDLIKNFTRRVDHFIFGGGIANTFLAAKKHKVGNSLIQKDKFLIARKIEQAIRNQNKNIHLPEDFVIAKRPGNYVLTHVLRKLEIPDGQMILDIGPRTATKMSKIISRSKTIIWNGPVGVCEARPFRSGTRAIAKAIIHAKEKGATTVLGGGDTVEALKTMRISHKHFTHVSTGGGAMLEFLEKGTLPGLEVLSE